MPRSRIDHLLLLKRLFRLTGVFFKGKETRRSALRKFHDYILTLEKDGIFEVKKMPSGNNSHK